MGCIRQCRVVKILNTSEVVQDKMSLGIPHTSVNNHYEGTGSRDDDRCKECYLTRKLLWFPSYPQGWTLFPTMKGAVYPVCGFEIKGLSQ